MEKKIKLVEIARSFSFKLNAGNYESRDFFCSQKAEVPENEAEKTSEKLYQFCKKEVMKSIADYKAEMNKPRIPTVEEWENMTPEQQEAEQEKKRAKAREKYQEDKKIGFIKRERCEDCGRRVPIGEKCPVCSYSGGQGDRNNQLEVN
jgi:hypothetical protein